MAYFFPTSTISNGGDRSVIPIVCFVSQSWRLIASGLSPRVCSPWVWTCHMVLIQSSFLQTKEHKPPPEMWGFQKHCFEGGLCFGLPHLWQSKNTIYFSWESTLSTNVDFLSVTRSSFIICITSSVNQLLNLFRFECSCESKRQMRGMLRGKEDSVQCVRWNIKVRAY